MAIKIDDDLMTLEINGVVISHGLAAVRGWWEVPIGRGSSTATRRSRADRHRAARDGPRQRRPARDGAA